MALQQEQLVVPPTQSDKDLRDFADVIQRGFRQLFSIGHTHIGSQGPLTVAPTAKQGAPGDVVIGNLSTGTYLFVKVSRTQWVSFGPGTVL